MSGTGLCRYSGEMPNQTGPNTPEGKETSSQNSRKHGLCSRNTLILPDETPEEYEGTRSGWYREFEPEGYHEVRLVDLLVRNDWLLKRAHRRLLEVEAAVVDCRENANPADWTAEQEHKVELMQRYKTAAERAFYRSLSAAEHLRKDKMRYDERYANVKSELEQTKSLLNETAAQLKVHENAKRDEPTNKAARGVKAKSDAPLTKAQMTFQGQKSAKKRRKIAILDQWVEIEIALDGRTVTTQYPPNETLIANGQKMWPAPEMVYRRLHFVHGVPDEYAWTTVEDSIRETGGLAIQRMSVDTWLDLIEVEKESGTGHLLPCGGNLPRPEERGGCDCDVCSANRAVLERRGAA